MALIATKKEDSKYSHLSKVYAGKEKTIQLDKIHEKIKFKKVEVKIERRDLIRNIALVLILGILGTAGYLMQKFIN